MTAITSYKSVLLSLIPAEKREQGHFSIALWTTDLNASAELPGTVHLLCPVHQIAETDLQPIDPRVQVTDSTRLTDGALEKIVMACDVVELPGNFGWRETRLGRRLMILARQHGKLCILGISSNRAKTMVMNAQHAGGLRRFRARIKSWDIRLTQRYMVRRCDGVRVVGQGLVPLVEHHAKSVHVDIASWVSEKNFRTSRQDETGPVRVTMASRLEPMKGVSVGIEAVAEMVQGGREVALQIIGKGEEESALRHRVAQLGLAETAQFVGQLAYPQAFFDAMAQTEFVLLTNLNDEQPRLIFDAISQGAIPICPRSAPYRRLGLDDRLLYERGNARDLGQALSALSALEPAAKQEIRAALTELARAHTIETMHAKRRAWVLSLLGRSM